MPIFFQKNVQSLRNTVLACHFFQIYLENYPAVMPIFDQKKRQFCEKYSILLAKKVNRMPFFSDSSRNFVKQCLFLLLSCQYFVNKKCILSKIQGALMSFFQNFHEKPLNAHIWSQKLQFCQNYTIL